MNESRSTSRTRYRVETPLWLSDCAARGNQRGGSAPPLVIGVWLGNDDGRPMAEVRGGTLPARLFREIAEAAVP